MQRILVVTVLVCSTWFFTSSTSSAKTRLTQDERVAVGQMRAMELNDQLQQHKVDLARARCERNGGSFNMNEVQFADEVDTRRRVRARDRGAVYQRGRTIVVDPMRLIFGAPRPDVDITSDYDTKVVVSRRACKYP